MKASNLGGAIIYIGEDSTIYVFPSHTYEEGADIIEINLGSYKYEYFPFINEIEHKSAVSEKAQYLKKRGYPFISIFLGEMNAKTGRNVN